MNKSEFVGLVASRGDITKAEAKRNIDLVFDTVAYALKKGDGKVTWTGFGIFSVKDRKARTGRNPQTGEALQIKAKRAVSFKAAKALSESLGKPKKAKKKRA